MALIKMPQKKKKKKESEADMQFHFKIALDNARPFSENLTTQ